MLRDIHFFPETVLFFSLYSCWSLVLVVCSVLTWGDVRGREGGEGGKRRGGNRGREDRNSGHYEEEEKEKEKEKVRKIFVVVST